MYELNLATSCPLCYSVSDSSPSRLALVSFKRSRNSIKPFRTKSRSVVKNRVYHGQNQQSLRKNDINACNLVSLCKPSKGSSPYAKRLGISEEELEATKPAPTTLAYSSYMLPDIIYVVKDDEYLLYEGIPEG